MHPKSVNIVRLSAYTKSHAEAYGREARLRHSLRADAKASIAKAFIAVRSTGGRNPSSEKERERGRAFPPGRDPATPGDLAPVGSLSPMEEETWNASGKCRLRAYFAQPVPSSFFTFRSRV